MTKLVRFSPNRELNRMQSEFDRIFNDFFPSRLHERATTHTNGAWVPSVDLSENEDGYNIRMDLPGVDKKDIFVEIDWMEGLNNRGFTFNNPDAKDTCGCGTSFSA